MGTKYVWHTQLKLSHAPYDKKNHTGPWGQVSPRGPIRILCKTAQERLTGHSTDLTPLQSFQPMAAQLSVLLHNHFSPSGEQPEQRIRILAHMPEQQTAGCIAKFHKYCCYIKHGGIITALTLWNLWGVTTDMSKYYNAGIWSID